MHNPFPYLFEWPLHSQALGTFFLIRRVFISRLPLCTTQRIHTLATRAYYNKNNERDWAKNGQTNFAMVSPQQNKTHSLLIYVATYCREA